jgi:heat shock protein HslJ
MTRRLPRAALLLAALTALAACQNTDSMSYQGQAAPTQDIPPPANLSLPEPDAPDMIARPPLVGTTWRLVEFRTNGGQTIVPTAAQAYTLQLRPDGRLAMRLSCNRGIGTWQAANPTSARGSLTLGLTGATRAACPPGPFDMMAGDFSEPVTYTVSGGRLYIMPTDDGSIYTWAPN